MNALNVFDFREQPVRLMGTPDAPLFVAADVCRVLGIANPSDALKGLDEDEKITLANSEGNPRAGVPHQMAAVTESGLYALIFKSRKAEAKAFRKWVTGEVLPAIRKTGGYAMRDAARGLLVSLLARCARVSRTEMAQLREFLELGPEPVAGGGAGPGTAGEACEEELSEEAQVLQILEALRHGRHTGAEVRAAARKLGVFAELWALPPHAQACGLGRRMGRYAGRRVGRFTFRARRCKRGVSYFVTEKEVAA